MSAKTNAVLRTLPSVNVLLKTCQALIVEHGREAVLESIRVTLEAARGQLLAGEDATPTLERLHEEISAALTATFAPSLRPVINATGVILHTNLGRAPLSEAANQAVQTIAGAYSTLEYDLESGGRGSRLLHAERALQAVTGAEAALVVNNNAAALLLLLSCLANGREVIISRGQLVEIGGGFRVPEVMAQGGVKLVEVGTTNRTRRADFAAAITPQTALLMRAHASNFKMIGFTEETPISELADLAHERGLLAVDDLGSGALLDTSVYGMEHEPTVQESLTAGMDIVAFSADKLLGGPQAGILVGKRMLIEQMKRHPLARAVRADKLCLAALSATLDHYRKGEAAQRIPIWQMIARPLADIQRVAAEWATQLNGEAIAGESAIGGGSLPGETVPTALVALTVATPDAFLARLRKNNPPIIARIADGRVLLDPRTVLAGQEADLLKAVSCLSKAW